jgi:hypothetical protein
MTRKLYIDGGKNDDVENKAGVLYNDTVQQFGKGKAIANASFQ